MFRSIALAVLLIIASPFAFGASPTTISSSIGATTVVPLQSYSSIYGMTPDATGQAYDIGYVTAGGSVTYTLNVPQSGTYSVLLSYSQPTGSSAPTISVNGTQQASVNFSTTGSYATYSTAFPASVTLPAGQVSLQIGAPTAGFNIGAISLQPTVATPTTSVSAQGSTSIVLPNFSWLSGMKPDSTGTSYDLGYINAGGYVLYPLNVAQAGVYTLTLYYSSPFTGTAANIVIDGSNQGSDSFANTGNWSSYTNATPLMVTLPAGKTNLEIFAQTGNFNIGALTLQGTAAATTTTIAASGLTSIPLQNHSSLVGMTPDNNGSPYDLGYVSAGGYAVFPLSVPQAGVYTLTMNYSSPFGSTGANVLINGTAQASDSFGNTGSWANYVNASPVSVSLPAGSVSLEILAQYSGFNLGGLTLQSSTKAVSTPIPAQGATIPLQNYSSLSGMTPDSNGSAFDLGYITAGGYATYPLVVDQAGKYYLTVNYSSPAGGSGVSALVNGASQASATLGNTGSYSTYTNAPVVAVTLPAGVVNLQIYAQTGSFNIGGLALAAAPQTNLSPLAYYVSPSGNDANDGKSPSTAFATLQKAAYVVQPGYTVYAMTGTYQNPDYTSSTPYQNTLTINTSGTASAPIVFTNYPGQYPKIQFSASYGIQVYGSYVTVSGFEIQGIEQLINMDYALASNYTDSRVNGVGISIAGSPTSIPTHITIQNMVIHDCPQNGIGVGYSDYVTVQDNTVYNNAYWSRFAGSGISFYMMFDSDSNTQTYKNVIQRNTSYGNMNYITNLFFTYGTLTDGNGIILDSFDHVGTSYPAYAGKTLVANNLIYSNGGVGISTFSSSNVDVINNTAAGNNVNMTNPLGQVITYYATNVNIRNNVMVAPAGKPVNLAQSSSGISYDYNVYSGGNGVLVTGVHDVLADPMFVSPSSANYQLLSGSPAIGTGIAWPYVTSDILQVARPGKNGIDRGAYQK